MSNINIASRMAHKRITRNTAGQIIDWMDETQGGWIIKKGQIVNEEAYQAHLKKEEDKRLAAQAVVHQISNPDTVNGTATPEQNKKITELETKVSEMDNKLDAILNALKK